MSESAQTARRLMAAALASICLAGPLLASTQTDQPEDALPADGGFILDDKALLVELADPATMEQVHVVIGAISLADPELAAQMHNELLVSSLKQLLEDQLQEDSVWLDIPALRVGDADAEPFLLQDEVAVENGGQEWDSWWPAPWRQPQERAVPDVWDPATTPLDFEDRLLLRE